VSSRIEVLLAMSEAIDAVLTPGQRRVYALITEAAPAAVLGGSTAMAAQDLLGPPESPCRRWGGLDLYLTATDETNWAIARPWPRGSDWPGPGPNDLRALPRIERQLERAGLEFARGRSVRPREAQSEGVRLEVRALGERVSVDVRSLHRDPSPDERRTGMLDPDVLARAKVYAATTLRQTTAVHFVDMATMRTAMSKDPSMQGRDGDAWLDATAQTLYEDQLQWPFDGRRLASTIANGMALAFRINLDDTREELEGVLTGDRELVDADLRRLLYYSVERMDPQLAQRWLGKGYGPLVERGVSRSVGILGGRHEGSINEHLRRAVERDHGVGH
jgi:hypothetical protein